MKCPLSAVVLPTFLATTLGSPILLSAEQQAGTCASVFGAQACTWHEIENGIITAVGVEIPLAAIESAPDLEDMTWPPPTTAAIDYPEAITAATGLRHMTINWEPMGHPPLTFLTPHFDFHFYLADAAWRTVIDCRNHRKPDLTPEGYGLPDIPLPPEMVALTGTDVLVGSCVPEMGMHAIKMNEAANSQPFEATLVVGYYDGDPLFFEPMIARAFLLQRRSFTLDIPSVPGLLRQPDRFSADYDSGRDAFRFRLSGIGEQ